MAILTVGLVQTAIYALLSGDATLQTLALNGNGVGIYDVPVPQSDTDPQPYPYVTIGDINAMVDDTKGSNGETCTGFVHCFSAYQGSKEWQGIISRVKALLHHTCLTLSTGDNWLTYVDLVTNFTEPDGHTRHGVLRYQTRITE